MAKKETDVMKGDAMVGQMSASEIVQPVAGQIPDVLQMITYTHHTIIR